MNNLGTIFEKLRFYTRFTVSSFHFELFPVADPGLVLRGWRSLGFCFNRPFLPLDLQLILIKTLPNKVSTNVPWTWGSQLWRRVTAARTISIELFKSQSLLMVKILGIRFNDLRKLNNFFLFDFTFNQGEYNVCYNVVNFRYAEASKNTSLYELYIVVLKRF